MLKKMPFIYLAFSILGAFSMSESATSHTRFRICPNCKMAFSQVQRYRGMKERVWETNEKVLEKISAKEKVLEKISAKEKVLEKISAKNEKGVEKIVEKEAPTRSLMTNIWQEFWPTQGMFPDR